MKKIWDLIRKLFRRSQLTKPDPSPPTPKTVGPQPTGEGQTCTEEEEDVGKDISTSAPNGSSTKGNTENETEDKDKTTSPQHNTPQTKDNNNTKKPKVTKGKNHDKEPPDVDGRREPKGILPKHEHSFISKPELVCREKSREFTVILSVPSHYEVKCVEQNGTPLQSEFDNEYIITDLSQPITLTTRDEQTEKFSLLYEEKYMIFKTRNNWEGTGYQIKNLTQGFFVVITPNTWNRESTASVAPAPCSDENYLVHFFKIDSSDELESVRFFNECERPPLRRKLFLEGTVIQDDSTRGKLFGQGPPTLKTPLPEEVLWIRIGQEGEQNPNSWSCNFKPDEKNLEDVLKNRYGHFFLRAYNKDIKLIDSIEFRYYGDLSEIQIDGQPYNPKQPLPPPRDGYKATHLEFIGTNDKLLLRGKIDPSKTGETVWTLDSESGKVNIVIDLPRIRWRLDSMDDGTCYDKPIRMTRDEFWCYAQSDTKLQIKLPEYIKRIEMGFNNNLDQRISIKKGIPLTSFVDYEEIDLLQSKPSHLQFAWNDIMVTAITIQPDQYIGSKIRPTVTGNRGLSRQGKGFSNGELKLANVDITRNDSNIYIDHRRRTVHQTNVKTLKEIYQCHR